MTKARDLADFVSAGNPLADGTIDPADINGVTATAAELNILDGVTATAAEINHLSGVTSAVQTQLNAKVETLGDLSITATATELNYMDGVTSAVQTQLDGKMTPTYTGNVDVTGNITVSGTVDGRDVAANIPASLGTAGQVLTVNSGATAGEWADAATGALEYISTSTASNSANLTFTLPSGYDGFLFNLTSILPANNTNSLYAKIGSSDNRFETVARATSVSSGLNSNGALIAGSLSGISNDSATLGVFGVLRVSSNYADSGNKTTAYFSGGYLPNLTPIYKTTSVIQTNTAATDTSVVFKFISGNITSGTITMYGYVAS